MIEASLEHIKDFYWSKRAGPRTRFDFGVFANVVPYEEKYFGTCRAGAASLDDQVRILEFDSDLNFFSGKDITKGEDPRTFIYKGEPHAITWDPSPSPIGSGNVFYYKVINLISGNVTVLSIENFSLTAVEVLGKNWMPLVKDDTLYFVITIEPQLCILRCDLESGECKWETPYEMVKDGLEITISRGGTPLIFHKDLDCYFGLGHRTYDCHNHSAFLYVVSRDLRTSYIGPDIPTSRPSGVSDPLSLFVEDEKFYCCIAHTPIQMGDTSEVTSALYEVTISER